MQRGKIAGIQKVSIDRKKLVRMRDVSKMIYKNREMPEPFL